MSSTRNPDSLTNAQGEFKPRIERDEPMMTSGHQPGRQVGNDAAPEFSAQVLPAGSAPADRSFAPNPIDETPGQANNPDTLRARGKESTYTSAQDTLGGATSADVHTGLGHPGSGQTAADDKGARRGGGNIVGSTADGLPGQRVDERFDPNQRGLEREEGAGQAGTRGNPGGQLDASDRVPESAETVAREAPS